MHEAKIASLILEKTAGKVSGYGDGSRVKVIHLAVGKFRNVDIESLQFAFDALKKEIDCLYDALLEIEEIEAVALCDKSKHSYVIELNKGAACPLCGSGVGRFESGQELEIRKIQMESKELDYA